MGICEQERTRKVTDDKVNKNQVTVVQGAASLFLAQLTGAVPGRHTGATEDERLLCFYFYGTEKTGK